MKKVIGYVISLAGVFLVAAPLIPQAYDVLPIPAGTPDFYVTAAGVLLVAFGAAFLVNRGGYSSGGRGRVRGQELPIYEGRNVVGYRRSR